MAGPLVDALGDLDYQYVTIFLLFCAFVFVVALNIITAIFLVQCIVRQPVDSKSLFLKHRSGLFGLTFCVCVCVCVDRGWGGGAWAKRR